MCPASTDLLNYDGLLEEEAKDRNSDAFAVRLFYENSFAQSLRKCVILEKQKKKQTFIYYIHILQLPKHDKRECVLASELAVLVLLEFLSQPALMSNT